MFRYSWNAVWNQKDRIFSLLNIFSVTMTMLILVALSGLLHGFKEYTEAVLNKLPLRIEIFKAKDALIEDLGQAEKKIASLPGFQAMYKRVPTFVSFLDAKDRIVDGRSSLSGCTMSPLEPLGLMDIHQKPVAFLSKQQLSQGREQPSLFDEIGIIVSFDFLKKLSYLPPDAFVDKPESWQKIELPTHVRMLITEGQTLTTVSGVELPVPVIGIIRDLQRGDYMITEDFYNILLNWRNPWRYMLVNRRHEPLVLPQPEIIKAYYILTEEELQWVEQAEILSVFEQKYRIKIFVETWETEEDFENRLNIVPEFSASVLKKEWLDEFEQKLRTYEAMKGLTQRKEEHRSFRVQTWDDFPKIEQKHQYMQATVYAEHRTYIEKMLESLRTLGLFASSPLEDYLQTFARQERFFVGATVLIFALVLFLSGVVLFSTFYSSILRKKREIGIFKAYGASRFLVLMLFYIQSTLIIIIGCGTGILGGMECGKILSQWLHSFVKVGDAALVFGLPPEYTAILTGVMFMTCWIAIFIPARLATAIDPADVIRT